MTDKTQAEKEFLKLKTLFIQVFNTEPGFTVLRYIMDELCGYQSTNIVNNTETRELLLESMLFNEAKRDTWLRIRRLLSKDILKRVEIDMERPKLAKPDETKSLHPYLKYRHKDKEENK